MTSFHTIEGVELVTAGMDWPASTGPVTFTLEMLSDAVRAANDDPMIVEPRVKVGHVSDVNGSLAVVSPFTALADAAPVFGRATNLRLTNDGAVIVADLVDVPEWINASSFPNRSVEATFDVQTDGGKRYLMVITAVSMLGEAFPAVADLEDLEALLTRGPEAVAAKGGVLPSAASVSTDVVRQRFNFEWAMSEPVDGVDTYWWWARDIRIDPAEVIADDDEGGLWSVPFSTDGKDGVTFGEPAKVREDFVPVAATSYDPQSHKDQRVLASGLGKPAKPAKRATTGPLLAPITLTLDSKRIADAITAAAQNEAAQGAEGRPETNEQEATVPSTLTPDQVKRLRDLPEDPTQDMIDLAIQEETEEQETPETPEAETPEVPEEPEVPVAAQRGVTVDKDALTQLQADAKAGREARDAQLAQERQSLVDGHVRKGKFPPSAAGSYLAQLQQGGDVETQTREFMEGLPDNTVPVEETGTSLSHDDPKAAQTEHDAYMQRYFPQARQRVSTRQEA